jgi:hypothetical protein
MLRKTTAVALLTLTGAALLPAASASALASVKTVTIHVVGIDRTGAQVGVASEVTAVHGNSQPGIGPAFHVKPGVYFISGDVRTAASGSTAASQTFVVRLVDVRTSRTIKLDSRGGRLVSVWLNGKDLGEPQDAGVCVADGHGGVGFEPT